MICVWFVDGLVKLSFIGKRHIIDHIINHRKFVVVVDDVVKLLELQ